MDQTLRTRIASHLDAAGYSDAAIEAGIAFADAEGYGDDDEALSLVVSHILYDAASLADGARFAVEPGSW
jgi:predicted transcriptional regulator